MAQRTREEWAELLSMALEQRDPDGPCVIFGRGGRGIIRFEGRVMTAAKVVWILAYGSEPGELAGVPLHVLHTCNGGSGVNGCIAFGHLRVGTHRQNMQDRRGQRVDIWLETVG